MIRIHYSNGQLLHGIVLAFGDRLVRVAIKDSDDAAEYRLVNQVWVSEDCEVVRFESVEQLAPLDSEEADPLEALFRCETLPASIPRVM